MKRLLIALLYALILALLSIFILAIFNPANWRLAEKDKNKNEWTHETCPIPIDPDWIPGWPGPRPC